MVDHLPTPIRRTRLYEAGDLLPLMNPRSVAVVGASKTGKGFGSSALRELISAATDRRIYTVHPRFDTETSPLGAIGVTSLAALPEAVDCVCVAVPAEAVEGVLRDAAGRGCKSAIVFSAGFGEVDGGAEAEARLGRISAETGLRIAGPNTAGIINYNERLPLTFVPELALHLPAGNLAIVSQSAGTATHLGHKRHRGLGVSYTITTGNSVDVTALDYANVLLDDPGTDVILLVLEGLENPQGFAELGARARRAGKPILTLKTGRTTKGGKAAVSHTGSLAGSHEIFVQAARDAGMPLFRGTEDLLETGQLFARWAGKPCRPGGVGILTTMGGHGVMAADAADDYDVDLPALSQSTFERLATLIPSFAAFGNPIDTTASPSDHVLTQCIEALGQEANFSALVVLAASQTGASTAQRPAAIIAGARQSKIPVCAVWLSSWLEAPSSEVLDAEPTLPVFRNSDRCLFAISHWLRWHAPESDDRTDREPPQLLTLSESTLTVLDGLLAVARRDEARKGPLSEVTSRSVIESIGIRVPRARVVRSAPAAALAAQDIDFPLVAKVVSHDIPHKAAVGGVRVGLSSAADVVRAYDDILGGVAATCPRANVQGVMVAEMIIGGTEFMCGMTRDPVFGPVVLCGAGGGDVEHIGDIGRCVGPITRQSAVRALSKVRAFQSLKSKRPEQAEVLERELTQVMMMLGALALAQPSIAEIEINPLVQRTGDNALVALDALVVLT